MSENGKVPSLRDILGELDKSPPPPETEQQKYEVKIRTQSHEEKIANVQKMRFGGVGIPSISKAYAVSTRTIHRWLAEGHALFLQSFEGETAATNISGHLLRLQDYEDMCAYQASQLGNREKSFDPVTGKVIESSVKDFHADLALKKTFIELGLKSRLAQIKILIDTGILPTEAAGLYRTPESEGKTSGENSATMKKLNRSRDELLSDTLNALDDLATL